MALELPDLAPSSSAAAGDLPGNDRHVSQPLHPSTRYLSEELTVLRDSFHDARGSEDILPVAKFLGQKEINDRGNFCKEVDGRMGRNANQAAKSPDDSGTEADDESGTLLKSLPAPPVKLRKGLKDAKAIGTPSPLLTPSYLDEECRGHSIGHSANHVGSPSAEASANDELRKIREKFTRRRRAELIRRSTEILLLSVVGLITSRGAFQSTARQEFRATIIVVAGIYCLYPFRLFFYHQNQSAHSRKPTNFLRIPAAFDPATLLYPVFLPVFVASSLVPLEDSNLVINLVLGIASMPRNIVPFQDTISGHTSVQWLLSSTPTFLKDKTLHWDSLQAQSVISSENLMLLFPLHQAVCSSLRYLTTTSLLPAELQLLSVSIVNVLLLSVSPQSLILKALLWIGGLSLFISCRIVLQWEVALARVPSWRFRRHDYHRRTQLTISRALRDLVHGHLSYASFIASTSEDIDADKSRSAPKSLRSRRKQLSLAIGRREDIFPEKFLPMPLSAVDHPTLPLSFAVDGPSSPKPSQFRKRSSTVPSFTTLPEKDTSRKAGKAASLRLPVPKAYHFQSLTEGQAKTLKWLCAVYVYATIVLLVALPIRSYVGEHALGGREPVGWALGYLFGDLPSFRHLVISYNLEAWIEIAHYHRDLRSSVNQTWTDLTWWKTIQPANVRLLICLHCLITIVLGLTIVLRLSSTVEVDTRRKVFHGMMVLMFLPTTLIDPTFVALALALVLAIFLLLDLFRASQLPPLSRPLTRFLAPYVDGRDHRGPVIVSHIFLLIGCSIPLWLSLASVERGGEAPWEGWGVPRRDLGMVSGVICVGMGDAAASLIGRRFGRRRWCWSGGKSLEGSLAFAVAVVLGLAVARMWGCYGGWLGDCEGSSWRLFLGKATVAAGVTSLTEAVLTGGNDNVIVPVILWLLVRGLEI